MDLKNEPRSPDPVVPVQVVQNVSVSEADDRRVMKMLEDYNPLGLGVNNTVPPTAREIPVSQNEEYMTFDTNGQETDDGKMMFALYQQDQPNLSSLTEEMVSMASDYVDCQDSFQENQISPDYSTVEQGPKAKPLLPKKFKCAMCAYRTRYKSDLNRHVRKHAIASYNCDVCNMPFKTSGNVEFHKRKQHGEVIKKPSTPVKYKCKYCNYDTLYSSDLTRHIRKHGVAKFHCGMCNRPFMTSGSLINHKRTYHNLENLEIVMGFGGMETVKQMNQPGGDSNINLGMMTSPDRNRQSSELQHENDNSEVIDLIDDEEMENKTEGESNTISSMIEVVQGSEDAPASTPNVNETEEGVEMSGVDDEDSREPDPDGDAESNPEPDSQPEHEKRLLVKIPGASIQKFKCPHCDKIFGRKLVLEFHLRSFHKMKKTAQKIWRKNLEEQQQSERTLTEDVNSNDTPNTNPLLMGMRHKCPYCSYGTMYKSTYDRHVKKHEFACYLCNICNMPFITLGHLLKHKRQTHPDYLSQHFDGGNNYDLKCPHCDFCAKDTGQLRLHCDSTHRAGHPRFMSSQSHNNPTVMTMTDSITTGAHIGRYVSSQTETNTVTTSDSFTPVSNHGNSVQIGSSPAMLAHQETLPNGMQGHQTPLSQPSLLEERVTTVAPTSSRYAKLVGDYDQFAEKPFACSLCFFRTADIQVLVRHVENHLTGCNTSSVPDTARIIAPASFTRDAIQMAAMAGTDLTKMFQDMAYPSQTGIFLPVQADPSRQPHPVRHPSKSPVQKPSNPGNVKKTEKIRLEPIVPTFSVHYRKDRNKRVKPYICLMCKKRFSHLVLLKQHFKVLHNDITSKVYQCTDCNAVFNDPMALQEHHDALH